MAGARPRGLSSSADLGLLGGSYASGLPDEVVAFGYVGGPTGGVCVCRRGGRAVAVELVQVAADGMPPVSLAQNLAQPVGLAQSGMAAEDVADRDRTTEHSGGILTDGVGG